MIEALDQQPRLFPDRLRDRAEHARDPLIAEPLLGGGDQRREHVLPLGLHQPPLPDARTEALLGRHRQCQRVDMRGDAANHAASLFGEE